MVLEEAVLEFDDQLLPIASVFEKRQSDSEAVRDLGRSEPGQRRCMVQRTTSVPFSEQNSCLLTKWKVPAFPIYGCLHYRIALESVFLLSNVRFSEQAFVVVVSGHPEGSCLFIVS